MSPELLQVLLVLGGAVVGWIARHNGVLGPSPSPNPPAPLPIPSVPLPTGIGKGQVLTWLLQEANVDLPKFLAALSQSMQPPKAA